MDLTIAQTVGVDISKDMLDVHLHPDNMARRFTNNSKGFDHVPSRGVATALLSRFGCSIMLPGMAS